VLDRWSLAVVVALLAVTIAGAGITYGTYVEPGTHTEQRPGPRAEYVGDFTHEATVQQPNPVFTVGQTLTEQSFYYSSLSPVLNGSFIYSYSATESGQLEAEATLHLVARSVGDRGDEEVQYWRISRSLDGANATLEPGDRLELTFSRNVTAFASETRAIDERLGGTPGDIEMTVVAVIETNGEVNGRPVSEVRRYRLGISPGDGIYRVDDPGTVANVTEQTRTITVENSYGLPRKAGGPLLVVFGVVGLGLLGGARYRDLLALTDAERRYLDYETTRSEFDDWITTARLPQDTSDSSVVDVADLEGLVDVAIDSNRRVLRDPSTGTYQCRVDDVVYRYDPPPEPNERQWVSDLLETTDGRSSDTGRDRESAANGTGTEHVDEIEAESESQ
jgi:hypothetical protein